MRLQTIKGHEKIGIVKRKCNEPRSYMIESDGAEYRRNPRHVLPVMEPWLSKSIIQTDEPELSQQIPDQTQVTENTELTEHVLKEQCEKQMDSVKTPSKVSLKCTEAQNKDRVQANTTLYLSR